MEEKEQRKRVSELRRRLLTEDSLLRNCILKLQADTRLHEGISEKDQEWVSKMADALRQWGKFSDKQKQVASKLAFKYADLIVAAEAEEENGRVSRAAEVMVAVEDLVGRDGWGEF